MIYTPLLAVLAGITILTIVAFCKMKKRFKLLSYDHNYNDENAFYGSDEMAMAYREYMNQQK